jgi:OFA family oxalate/formate antiporter-like MFS transporter
LTDPSTPPPKGRWTQLCLGVLSMILIANLQYAWTLFVDPMDRSHHWGRAGIQLAFSIFVATETWLTPFAGAFVDRLGPLRGPRVTVALGGILVGIGWTLNAYADSLAWLYIGSAITGTGGGAIYATCVGSAVKWFPDRRGLAVGLTAGGFGAGAALTILPISWTIAAYGYESAFLWFGIGQGAVLLVVSQMLRAPTPADVLPKVPSSAVAQSSRSYTPGQVLASPVFWLMYVMFVAISASGLMATAQLAPIAKDFGIDKTVLFLGASLLNVALIVDSVLNGLARPFFGAVSDKIGREATVAIAFGIGAVSYGLLAQFGASPWSFVLLGGLIFFTWGEIFSLFPSTCTDTFGPKYATTNAALLYTAKGTSAFLVPLANVLKNSAGGWGSVFLVAAVANIVVVALALFVLKPLRTRLMRG